jgi:hypothetical protein
MKEPQKIPLTNNPRSKDVKKFPLTQSNQFDIQMQNDTYSNPNNYKTFWKLFTINDEDNSQNNSTSIQQLESESSD